MDSESFLGTWIEQYMMLSTHASYERGGGGGRVHVHANWLLSVCYLANIGRKGSNE